MRRASTARFRALQWFKDYERDPASLLMRTKPSTRMRRLLANDGLVMRVPVGQFGYQRWLLTDQGQDLLNNKRKRLRGIEGRALPHAICL
jgi:hypothetical protein